MLADVLTPVSMLLEFVIVIIGCYAGFVLKKQAGYFFALAFLLFGLYDYFTLLGLGADAIALVNIVAVLAALGGILVVVRKE